VYLGREQNGTDTLAKALAHWQRIGRKTARERRTATGLRKDVLSSRQAATADRIALLKHHFKLSAAAEAERHRREQEAAAGRRRREQEAELAGHWRAIDRLHRMPSAEHAQAAKRALRLPSNQRAAVLQAC
jgi:hypothetical protein